MVRLCNQPVATRSTPHTMASSSSSSTASVPSGIGDWLATPAPCNSQKYGENAIFSEDDSVVERREPAKYGFGCVVYTRDPLPLGHVWQTTVGTSESQYIGKLVSGSV